MRTRRFLFIVVAAALLLGGLLAPAPAPTQQEACFAETGYCVRGRFLDYWLSNGGLARNGFPLSEERRELLEDGNEYTVQYFERVRLEHHPENPPPYEVLLGHFGRRVSPFVVPEPLPAIDDRFRGYWEANGGLAQFGYAISIARQQRLEDGNEYTVQYFERARFELHPEYAGTPYEILLGQFGRQVLTENELVAEPFRYLFIVRQEVGSPVGPATVTPATYLPFERGALIYRSDTQTILLFDRVSGTDGGYYLTFPNTWDPSQPVGGGPGPAPGLYEPSRGFGTLWRENANVRDRLGYATAPDETGYMLTIQTFLARVGPSTTLFTRPDGATAYAVAGNGQRIVPLR